MSMLNVFFSVILFCNLILKKDTALLRGQLLPLLHKIYSFQKKRSTVESNFCKFTGLIKSRNFAKVTLLRGCFCENFPRFLR